MRILAKFLFYGWSGALLVLGGLGVFTGAWEIRSIFQIDLEGMGREATANLLNQYRFLKAVEFGFGLFCFVFRNEIFRLLVFNRLFVSVVFLGAAARALSIVLEGWPHWGFIGVTLLEFLTGIVVVIYSRQTVERP
jgi:hypothetical protein